MNNPNNNYGEGIQPPRTGDYELSQLLQYPNARVRALAEFLRNGLHWTTRDSFTGECISHLINYVEQNSDGSFNFSRIHSGSTAEQNIAWYHFRQGDGADPLRIIYVETREEFYRRNGERGMRIDGTYMVDFEHIHIRGGRSCFDIYSTSGRGLRHFAPGNCHSW